MLSTPCLPRLPRLQRGTSGERKRVDPVIKEASFSVARARLPPAAAPPLPPGAACPRLRRGAPPGGPASAPRALPRHRCGSRFAPLLLPPLQAAKRGLDVDRLHGSRTPAWRNLRGRSASARKKSYYEGPEEEDDGEELQDQPSGSEGGEDGEGEGSEEEGSEEEHASEDEVRREPQRRRARAAAAAGPSCRVLSAN